MAFSLVVLESADQAQPKPELPLGFSWPVLLAPHLIALLASLINTLLLAAFGITGISEVHTLSSTSASIYYVSATLMLAIWMLSFCIVPLLKKDAKWTMRMLLSGILTLGISVWVFAFIYNKILLEQQLQKGFHITAIKNLDGEDKPLASLNPIHYNPVTDNYSIWVSWFGIKFKRYYADLEQAITLVKQNPGSCLSVRHIHHTLASIEADSALKQRYALPFDTWMEMHNHPVNQPALLSS